MEAVFLKILSLSILASWLVLAIIVLRLILRNAPKWIFCALWALVAIRLLVPFSFESTLSLLPSTQTVSQGIVTAQVPQVPMISHGLEAANSTLGPVPPPLPAPNPAAGIHPAQGTTAAATGVWLLGLVSMLLYALVSYLRLYKKVRAAICTSDRIWLCDDVKTPFILGLIHPKIYLPSDMQDAQMGHVIAHERAHIQRLDFILKPLGFLILSVYWFNPVIWIAYSLFCRDTELACDECVVRQMELDEKKSYAQALVDWSNPRRVISACPLAFGEVGVKGRVKHVLRYKKPTLWIIALGIAACIVLAICFLTSPKAAKQEDINYTQTPLPELTPTEETPAALPELVPMEEMPVSAVPDDAAEAPPQDSAASAATMEYFFLQEAFAHPDRDAMMASHDIVPRLKQFEADLSNLVARLEYHSQFLVHDGRYTGDAKFSNNGLVNEDIGGVLHTKLQTLMLGESTYSILNDKIDVGSNFDQDDFVVSSVADVIPVILGCEYRGIYDLGDELSLSLFEQPLTFVVKGFLQENASPALNGYRPLQLDQSVVVPIYDIAYEPTDQANAFYQKMYYFMKLNGHIGMAAEVESTLQKVTDLAEKYDLLFTITPVPPRPIHH